MSSSRRSISGWFSTQTAGKLALVAAIIVSILVWGAFLFGPSEPNPPIEESADSVIPDLVAVIDVPSSLADEWLASARSDLERVPGVSSTSVDWLSGGLTAFYIGTDDAVVDRRSLPTIVADVEEVLAESARVGQDSVEVAGRLLDERNAVLAYRSAVVMLIALAVIIGFGIAWLVDWRVGLMVAIAGIGSLTLAPLVARQVVGPFDGTLASTDVITALGAFITTGLVCWRLVAWFANPRGADGATLIRRSVSACCTDVAAVSVGLLIVGAVLAAISSITHPVWSTLVGVCLAGVVSGAIVAPGLAALAVKGAAGTAAPSSAGNAVLPPWSHRVLTVQALIDDLKTIPSTPVSVVGCLAGLVLLAVFAFGEPSNELIGASSESGSSDIDTSVEDLYRLGAGNPTEGLVVTVDESSETTISDVATTIVPLTSVAWVDTAVSRHIGADEVDSIDGVGLLTPTVLSGVLGAGTATPSDIERAAIVVPAVSLASADGAELIDNIRSLDGVSVQSPAVADLTTRGSGRLTLVVVALLAVMSAVTAYAMAADRIYGITTGLLALVIGLAVAGIYRLASGLVPAAELLTVVVLAMVCFLLWVLAYARPRSSGGQSVGAKSVDGGDVVLLTSLAITGSVLVAVSALFGAGPGIARLGLGLASVLAVVALAGMGLLGPALLGQTAVFHRLVRPIRSAHHPDRPSSPVAASLDDRSTDTQWTTVAADLIGIDFRIQQQPRVGDGSEVALPGTPIFDEVELRQTRLLETGLRVTGSQPVVRRVDIVRDGRCPSLLLTIDHPERKLLAADGTVVGVRRSERQSMVMWLAAGLDRPFVMAEAVETGTYPLDYVDLRQHDREPITVDLSDGSAITIVGD